MMHPLSARQRECLEWAARGKSYQDTADIMGLSWATVKVHLDLARLKLNAINVTQAACKALARGLITLDEQERAAA